MLIFKLNGPLQDAATVAENLRLQFPDAFITWTMEGCDTYNPIILSPDFDNTDTTNTPDSTNHYE